MRVAIRSYGVHKHIILSICAVLVVFGVAAIALSRMAAAAPAIISVTTTVDEDSHPVAGSGCSIYEASVAANTGSAYGGCAAGDLVEGSVIQVPAGTYPAAIDGFGFRAPITLNNASLTGAGATTILQAYDIELTGNAAAQLSDLTIAMNPTTPSASTLYVLIGGDNKTVQNITLNSTNPDQFYYDIRIGQTGQNQIDEATISNVVSSSTMGAMGGVTIECFADIFCSNMSLNAITLNALYDIRLNLSLASAATISQINITAEYSNTIRSGEDSLLTDVTLNPSADTAQATIETMAGTVIDGVTMNDLSDTGVTMRTIGIADEVSNVTMIADRLAPNSYAEVTTDALRVSNVSLEASGVDLRNSTSGAVIDGATLVAGENSVDLYVDAAEIRNITADAYGSGTIYFYNFATGATVVEDVIFEEIDVAAPGMTVSIQPATSATVRRVQFLSNTNNGTITIDSPAITVEGMRVTSAMVQINDSSSATLQNMTLDGSSLFSLQLSGNTGPVTIEDSYIANANGAILANGSGAPTETLVIRNTQIENLTGTFGPKAVLATAIEEVTIDSVTIDQVASPSFDNATIEIVDGFSHQIINTTIGDGVGSIGVLQSVPGRPVSLAVRHASVINSGVGPAYAVAGFKPALSIDASEPGGIEVSVSNSFIVGVDDYSSCLKDSDSTLTVVASIASSASCITEGFTAYTGDIDALVSDTLSDDTSEGPAIGFASGVRFLQTRELPSGSPAIASANTALCLARDARNVVRDVARGCDMGAYAFTIPLPPAGGGPTTESTGSPSSPVAVTVQRTVSPQSAPVVITSEPEAAAKDEPTRLIEVSDTDSDPTERGSGESSTPFQWWIVIVLVGVVIVGTFAVRSLLGRR